VAPNQYEFAPMFGTVTTQIDQNLMVMQIIEEAAVHYGLAALLQEKPFQGFFFFIFFSLYNCFYDLVSFTSILKNEKEKSIK
jgi:hypothetical protein